MLRNMVLSVLAVLLLSGVLFAQSIQSDKNQMRVTYFVPEASVVTVTLYEADGAELKTIVNEFKEAGQHELSISKYDLPQDLYYLSIRAGDYYKMKQIINVE